MKQLSRSPSLPPSLSDFLRPKFQFYWFFSDQKWILWYSIFGWNLVFFLDEISSKTENYHIFWLRAPRWVLRSFLEVPFSWLICGWNSLHSLIFKAEIRIWPIFSVIKKKLVALNMYFFASEIREKNNKCPILLI